MKRLSFFVAIMMASVCTMAQLTVNSVGNTTAKNLKLIGTTGVDSIGVLTITSTNASNTPRTPATFIVTKTNDDIYPFVHYKYGNPLFFINDAGQVYSSMYVSFSDSTSKTNIEPLQSTLEKLKRLRGMSFHYKTDLEETGNSYFMAATPEIREQMLEEHTRKRVGLIAQEVEEVFPEVVRTQFDGKKGVMYNDLVGVLISAINELEEKYTSQISCLQNQLNATQAVLYANNGTRPQIEQQDTQSNVNFSEAVLYQNTPNPFKQETTIAYRLPSEIQTAAICIYNLNGQQLKKFDLDATVISNSVTIDGSTLTAGMYIYALIIDGQLVASKRMILTE